MFDLSIDQGCDYSIALFIKDNEGVLVDLTGFSFESQARLSFAQTLPDFSFTFTPANQITNPGEVQMSLARGVTQPLPLTEMTAFHYDVEMLDTLNQKTRIMYGMANVYPEATR